MAPILERNTLTEERYKFVRDGETVAVDDPEVDHVAIARTYHLGTPSESVVDVRDVDDAGRILNLGDTLLVRGSSVTCRIRGSREAARAKTGRVVSQITGIAVDTLED